MKIFVFLFIAFICCSCRRSLDSKRVPTDSLKWDKNKKLEFLTYGLPRPSDEKNAADIISKKWGFRTKSVAGCLVTEKLVDSVRWHNEMVENALIAKLGIKWNNKYHREVDRELKLDRKVIRLLDLQKRNIIKRRELEKEGNDLHYNLWPLENGQGYEVYATGWGEIKGKSKYVTYFKYNVNLNDSSVKLISDIISIY